MDLCSSCNWGGDDGSHDDNDNGSLPSWIKQRHSKKNNQNQRQTANDNCSRNGRMIMANMMIVLMDVVVRIFGCSCILRRWKIIVYICMSIGTLHLRLYYVIRGVTQGISNDIHPQFSDKFTSSDTLLPDKDYMYLHNLDSAVITYYI